MKWPWARQCTPEERDSVDGDIRNMRPVYVGFWRPLVERLQEEMGWSRTEVLLLLIANHTQATADLLTKIGIPQDVVELQRRVGSLAIENMEREKKERGDDWKPE